MRARLERKLAKLQRQIDGAEASASQAQASIAALDSTMALVEERLERTAAGEVNAWAGKYGKRGALGVFLEETLRQAAPEPLTKTALLDLTAQKFGLLMTTPCDRRSLKNSVTSALSSLLKRRRVEPLHSRAANSHGLWRWVGESTATLEQLALQAEELEAWR